MTKIVIHEVDEVHEVHVTDEAKSIVRFSFNPSGNHGVNRVKALSAALISEIISAQGHNPEAGWEFDTALRFAQSASMWAVLGITK